MCWDGNTEWRRLGSAPSRDPTPPVVTWRDVRPSRTKPVHERSTCRSFERRLPVILMATTLRQRQPFVTVQHEANDEQTHVVAVLPVSVSYTTFTVNQANVWGAMESPQTAATKSLLTSQKLPFSLPTSSDSQIDSGVMWRFSKSLITAFRAGESSVSWSYCRFEKSQTSKKPTQQPTWPLLRGSGPPSDALQTLMGKNVEVD